MPYSRRITHWGIEECQAAKGKQTCSCFLGKGCSDSLKMPHSRRITHWGIEDCREAKKCPIVEESHIGGLKNVTQLKGNKLAAAFRDSWNLWIFLVAKNATINSIWSSS